MMASPWTGQKNSLIAEARKFDTPAEVRENGADAHDYQMQRIELVVAMLCD